MGEGGFFSMVFMVKKLQMHAIVVLADLYLISSFLEENVVQLKFTFAWKFPYAKLALGA